MFAARADAQVRQRHLEHAMNMPADAAAIQAAAARAAGREAFLRNMEAALSA